MISFSSTVKFASEEVIDRFLDNVDAWQAIFEILSVRARIRLEMTNKRLHILMLEYWKRVTSFDSKNCLTEVSYDPSIKKNRWADIVSICVNRIGDGLRSLTIIEKCPIGCWSANVSSIGEGCPNVETINFIFDMNYMSGNRTFDIRFDSFAHLKALTVSTPRGYYIEASPSLFLSIPISIEMINGLEGTVYEPFENAAQIESFFADRPSLRAVRLRYLYTRDRSKADIFRVIAQRCPNLKSIKLFDNIYINYRGVVALELMKQLCIRDALLDEMQTVTFCERSPLVEVLDFTLCFSSNIDLQSAALKALGALAKLRGLQLFIYSDALAPSLVTGFIRDLARNSGASLLRLYLNYRMSLPTAAIEALANGCGKLRDVDFYVRVGEATPASIRFLIDCIVAHPSWITQTDHPTLVIRINVIRGGGDYDAGYAAFEALAAPAANLPTGVQLDIWKY